VSTSQAAARVYASALVDIGVEAGNLDTIAAELRSVSEVLADLDPDLRTFFEVPQLRREDKWQIISTAFEGKVSRPVLGLLHVLVDRRREALLGPIVSIIGELVDEREGRVRASVVSAQPLDPELAEALRAAIERQAQRTVVLDQRVDPAMIGGIRVSMGDLVVDGTLRRGLSDLRRTLASSLT
jgi:F-type H+-transporting ATPase subunit delta